MKVFVHFAGALVRTVALLLAAGSAAATPYHLMLQTRQDSAAPFEVFVASFNGLNDVYAGTTSAPTAFSEIAISPDFRVAGFAYDGSYRLMVQTRLDSAAPFEVFLASFDTLDDVFAGTTTSPTAFTEIAISPDYRVAGLAYDGSYRVMLQTRQDSAAPFEVFVASFDTLGDLFAGNTVSPTVFSEVAISPDYRIAGFTYDGSYRVMLQTRQDSAAPFEVFVASFDNLDDLLAGTTSSPTAFSEIAVSPDYEIVGFTGEWLPAVPEPGSYFLFGCGLVTVGLVKKRKPR